MTGSIKSIFCESRINSCSLGLEYFYFSNLFFFGGKINSNDHIKNNNTKSCINKIIKTEEIFF